MPRTPRHSSHRGIPYSVGDSASGSPSRPEALVRKMGKKEAANKPEKRTSTIPVCSSEKD